MQERLATTTGRSLFLYQDLLHGIARSAAETVATAIRSAKTPGWPQTFMGACGPSSGLSSLGCSSLGIPLRPPPRLQQEQ
jgi:hypothetical protein